MTFPTKLAERENVVMSAQLYNSSTAVLGLVMLIKESQPKYSPLPYKTWKGGCLAQLVIIYKSLIAHII